MKNRNVPGLVLIPARETILSTPLVTAERTLAALPVYAGLLGMACTAFGWPMVWSAVALGVLTLVAAVWCALGHGWRQWLPALTAVLTAAWFLLLPQAQDSAAGLVNGVLDCFQRCTGYIHLPLTYQDTAAVWAAIPAAMVLGALLGSLGVYAPAVCAEVSVLVVALSALGDLAVGPWAAVVCFGAVLLCLGHRRGCRRSPGVSLWTAALLALLAILAAGAVLLAGLPTLLEPSVAENALRERVHALRYESAPQAMPEGRLDGEGVHFSDTEMLRLTLSQPQAMYLRGFIGQRYTRTGWEALSADSLSEQADEVYWLQNDGFFGQSQLSLLAERLSVDTPEISAAIEYTGACRRYALLPYELAENHLCMAEQLRDTMPKGSGSISFTMTGSLTDRAYELLELLSQRLEDPQMQDYLEKETVYRQQVYQNYLTIPEDTQKTLTAFLGKAPASITSYEAKSRIRECLAETVEYDETAVDLPADADPVSSFLQEMGRGSAVQYATAAVMMLRYYGIPARYVEGYLVTPEAVAGRTGETTLTLTGNDAHAWAEYYEDGVGWIPFETAAPYLSVMPEAEWRWFQPDEDAELTGSQAQEGGGQSSTVRHSTVETVEEPTEEPEIVTVWNEITATLRSGLTAIHAGRWALWLLLLAMLAAVLTVILRRAAVCRRRREAFDGADAAKGTAALFAYAMELMWHSGLTRENRPVLSMGSAVTAWAGESVDFDAVAWLNAEASYSTHPITEEQRSRMRQFAADTLHRFRRKLKPWQRLYQKWIRCMY